MLAEEFDATVEALYEVKLFRLAIDLTRGFPMPMLVFVLRVAAKPRQQIAGLGRSARAFILSAVVPFAKRLGDLGHKERPVVIGRLTGGE